MFLNALPNDPESVKRGIQATNRVKSYMKEAPFEWDDIIATLSPSPVLITEEDLAQYVQINQALAEALHCAVVQWHRDPRLQEIFQIHPRIAAVLEVLKDSDYKLGSIRPDILVAPDGTLRVCEINARFPLNGFFFSGYACDAIHRECMNPDSIFAEKGLVSISSTARCISHVTEKLTGDDVDTIWILMVNELLLDLDVLEYSTKTKVKICHPEQLACRGSSANGLFVKTDDNSLVEIRSFISLLRQNEFLLLNDDVLEAVAILSSKGRALNDLRTIFLVHDKRMLHVIRSGMLDLSQSTVAILEKHIIPTMLSSTFQDATSFMKNSSLVLKPCRLGKGKGIMMEKNFQSRAEFLSYVDEASVDEEYIIQPYQQQRQFQVMNSKGNLETAKAVGALLSIDGCFYGPGLFRFSNSDLVSLLSGAIPTFAVWKVNEVPSFVRSYAPSLREANYPNILKSLVRDGLAVVGVKKPLGSENDLRYFLKIGLGAKTHSHSDTTGDVWDVKPRPGWTLQDARSHTSNPFEIHTDASFEPVPPRFVAMTVIHADRLGGGFLSLIKINSVVQDLSEEETDILKKTKVQWRVPPEFKKAGRMDTIAPVLMSENRARFRQDIVSVDNLTEVEAGKFLRVFEKFCRLLQIKSEENKILVPEQSVIIIDNQRYAHARTKVLDSTRHLQRVRFELPGIENELVN